MVGCPFFVNSGFHLQSEINLVMPAVNRGKFKLLIK